MLTTPASASKDPPPPPVQIEPPPDWDRYRELAEEAVRAQLVDPDSAKFSWPYGYKFGAAKQLFSRRVPGYVTCGLVNSRNRFGGYTGNAHFMVAIHHDQVAFLEIGNADSSLFAEACAKANFPSAAGMPSKARPAYGIEYSSVPEGILIAQVFAGSLAEKSGIKSGMIIAKVNGVALAGMDRHTAQQVLMSVSGNASLEIVGGEVIVVERP